MKTMLAPKTKPLEVLTFMWQTFSNQHVFVMRDLEGTGFGVVLVKGAFYLEGHHHSMVTMSCVGLCHVADSCVEHLVPLWLWRIVELLHTYLLGCGDLLCLCGLWRSVCICARKCKCE
jgi:hypothetical protein